MPLPWPMISTSGGDLPQSDIAVITATLNRLGDMVEAQLGAQGLPPHTSPLFRSWNLYVIRHRGQVTAVFTRLQGGVANVNWMDRPDLVLTPEQIAESVRAQTGHEVMETLALPAEALNEGTRDASVRPIAAQLVERAARTARLSRLGDLSGVEHLAPSLSVFLDDHAEPSRNVFVMMRFDGTPQLAAIMRAIRDELATHGYAGVRADDRDYTGELWSNVQVYMHGCTLGIAVFEDIDVRTHNPNVALELGYMIGRQRRCLILKEQRLPQMPTDVVHRLYKPFDAFDIEQTVRNQVRTWVEVDLRNRT